MLLLFHICTDTGNHSVGLNAVSKSVPPQATPKIASCGKFFICHVSCTRTRAFFTRIFFICNINWSRGNQNPGNKLHMRIQSLRGLGTMYIHTDEYHIYAHVWNNREVESLSIKNQQPSWRGHTPTSAQRWMVHETLKIKLTWNKISQSAKNYRKLIYIENKDTEKRIIDRSVTADSLLLMKVKDIVSCERKGGEFHDQSRRNDGSQVNRWLWSERKERGLLGIFCGQKRITRREPV